MAYIAPRSLEESGCVDEDILGKMGSRNGMGRLKIKSLDDVENFWVCRLKDNRESNADKKK